jgi:hypothetical protein
MIDKECCNCGGTYHTDAVVCPDCGSKLEPMTTEIQAAREEI